MNQRIKDVIMLMALMPQEELIELMSIVRARYPEIIGLLIDEVAP
jgi:hypothetical protein